MLPSASYGRTCIAAGFHSLSIAGNPKKSLKPRSLPPPTTAFMWETIHKISSILRSLPWDSAREELRLFPIRWDSFTVNRVLKTHPPMEKSWLFFNWAGQLPGFKHDHFTYTTMLDIFGEAGRIASMRQILSEMEEKGLKIDAVTYTSVMHWLAKDGDFLGALEAWEEMRGRRGCFLTVVSYTAFMKVLFDYGRPQEAAEVYQEMLESGLRPNCHTYTAMMEYLVTVENKECLVMKEALHMQEGSGTGVEEEEARALRQRKLQNRHVCVAFQSTQDFK